MQNLELTKSEKKELEKRGFITKKLISFYDLILLHILGTYGLFICIWIWALVSIGSIFSWGFLLIFSLLWLYIFWGFILFIFYMLLWVLFYSENWSIINWKIYQDIRFSMLYKFFSWLKNTILSKKEKTIKQELLDALKYFMMNSKQRAQYNFTEQFYQYDPNLVLYSPIIGYIVLGVLYMYSNTVYSHSFWDIFYFLLPFLCIFCSSWWVYIFWKIIQSFTPLYAFWNLWEKIQKLTPRIEEESKQIQKNFQKDMNFKILSDWFDTLSSIFSDIISLVIKLEKVEQRANKGNLFDSEKYINSLRSDIIEPLKSLRIFLEKQKTKLIESYKELSKVQVRVGWSGKQDSGIKPEWQEWGSQKLDSVTSAQWQKQDSKSNMEWQEHSGWQEQIELSSKRSESLIAELTENIEKLDVMIEKISE